MKVNYKINNYDNITKNKIQQNQMLDLQIEKILLETKLIITI